MEDKFVKIIDGVIPLEFSNSIINSFEAAQELNSKWIINRQESEAVPKSKKDDASGFIVNFIADATISTADADKLYAAIFSKVREYAEEFAVGMIGRDGDVADYTTPLSAKIQKTMPSQGYHVWHCENSAIENSGRVLAWILYLNDVDEGGETEFLYLSKRIAPKQGRLVIFPAGWTHTHRGNPPLSGCKYIVTSWVTLTV